MTFSSRTSRIWGSQQIQLTAQKTTRTRNSSALWLALKWADRIVSALCGAAAASFLSALWRNWSRVFARSVKFPTASRTLSLSTDPIKMSPRWIRKWKRELRESRPKRKIRKAKWRRKSRKLLSAKFPSRKFHQKWRNQQWRPNQDHQEASNLRSSSTHRNLQRRNANSFQTSSAPTQIPRNPRKITACKRTNRPRKFTKAFSRATNPSKVKDVRTGLPTTRFTTKRRKVSVTKFYFKCFMM